jgi:hypothetical protein
LSFVVDGSCSREWIQLRRVGFDIQLPSMYIVILDTATCYVVGNGTPARFWKDYWLDGDKVADITPNMVKLVYRRCADSRSVKDSLTGLWLRDARPDLGSDALMEFSSCGKGFWPSLSYQSRRMCWCGVGRGTANNPPSRPMKLSSWVRSRPPSRMRFGASGHHTTASSSRGTPRRTDVVRRTCLDIGACHALRPTTKSRRSYNTSFLGVWWRERSGLGLSGGGGAWTGSLIEM